MRWCEVAGQNADMHAVSSVIQAGRCLQKTWGALDTKQSKPTSTRTSLSWLLDSSTFCERSFCWRRFSASRMVILFFASMAACLDLIAASDSMAAVRLLCSASRPATLHSHLKQSLCAVW